MSSYFPNIPVLPITLEQATLFISYCMQRNLAFSTVSTYISTLNYVQKMANFEDISQNFVIKKMLQGYRKMKAQADTRLPITPSILKQLVQSLEHLGLSKFMKILLKAMYLLAFHAFLRVGEMTYTSNCKNNLQFDAIQFCFESRNTSRPVAVELNMKQFKHHIGKSCRKFSIPHNPHNNFLCPVHALWEFCKLRGNNEGPLFCFMDGVPVSRQFFTKHLQWSLNWTGYNVKDYKSHSFRIGAATTAAAMGISDEQIQMMGRWNSLAFKKYVRLPLLQL